MHLDFINLLSRIIINSVASGYVSCMPIGYQGCDIDQCGCDGCASNRESCWREDTCYMSDKRKCSIDNCIDSCTSESICPTSDICMCYDQRTNPSRSDLSKCLTCDSGPPADNCTTDDVCDSAFGGTYDWVDCGQSDWGCKCQIVDLSYGPDTVP